MAGSAGEVTLALIGSESNSSRMFNTFPSFPDGAGEGEDSAQVHADDEPRVAAGCFRRRRPSGSLHGEEEAAARALSSNK